MKSFTLIFLSYEPNSWISSHLVNLVFRLFKKTCQNAKILFWTLQDVQNTVMNTGFCEGKQWNIMTNRGTNIQEKVIWYPIIFIWKTSSLLYRLLMMRSMWWLICCVHNKIFIFVKFQYIFLIFKRYISSNQKVLWGICRGSNITYCVLSLKNLSRPQYQSSWHQQTSDYDPHLSFIST